MRNVIYINCYVDPWLKVAQKLHQENELKPVYWVGYRFFDHSDSLVPKIFPGVIYQDYIEAFRGVFPKIVDEWCRESFLDIDFLRSYASQELQAMTMMDRLDPMQHNFSFMERQRHYRNLVKRWIGVIKELKVDMVISTVSPHRIYDYALYNLCKYYGIPYIILEHTAFPGRYIVYDNVFSINSQFVDDWHKNEEEENLSIPKDILDRFSSIKGEYNMATPYYMKTTDKIDHKTSNIIRTIINYWNNPNRKKLFGKDGLFDVGSTRTYKKRTQALEKSYYSNLEYIWLKIRTNKIKDEIKKYYESLTQMPDFSKPYVILFLHYQPEDTTCPCGDVFVNQYLCVELMLKYLPQEYNIYIKEHPHQFLHYRQGSSCRIKEFYSDLIRNERVKLLPTTINSFELIDKSKAVSTITGTVGWEAIVRQKPVLLFGISWFENYKGVLRIKDESSAMKMFDFIKSYKYDEKSLLAYLAAVGDGTNRAYYYMSLHKDILNISEDECVDNIVSSLLNAISL